MKVKDLTPQNQANFAILVDSAKNIIILTDKDGYAINNKDSLNSNVYTFNLTIAAILAAADLNIIEVADLENQNISQQLIVLKKLFSGEDLVDMNQHSFTAMVDTLTKIVTLTAQKILK
ncbi:MAG: hypothetical protein ACRC9U_02275 [Metamycoplasmataceae bacterium]